MNKLYLAAAIAGVFVAGVLIGDTVGTKDNGDDKGSSGGEAGGAAAPPASSPSISDAGAGTRGRGAQDARAPAQGGSGGGATLVLGGYPDKVMFVNEADGAISKTLTLDTGLPTRLVMSNDRKTIYATTITESGIEVIDAETREVVNSFSLNSPAVRYRFGGGAPGPQGRYFYTIGTRIEKEIDRYRVSDQQYLVIDLEERKVVRSINVAKEDRGSTWRTRMLVSEDGETLFVMRDKVAVIDIEDFEVVERFDLANPTEPGMRSVSFGQSIETLRTPGEYVSLFNARDPYIHNEVFGIARFDLASRSFEFDPIGPAPDRMSGLMVTPDGKHGYAVTSHGALGDRRCEFWKFELATNTALDKGEFPCRSRFSFGMSSDGGKLYIYAAGFEIEVFDAETFQPENVWALNADITGAGMLFIQ